VWTLMGTGGVLPVVAIVVALAETCEPHRDHRTARSTSTCPMPTWVSSWSWRSSGSR
jgi:hypothetical protein